MSEHILYLNNQISEVEKELELAKLKEKSKDEELVQ